MGKVKGLQEKTRGDVPREDKCVIYSDAGGPWICHGLHTDQIGTGIHVLPALVDYLKGVDNLKALIEEGNNLMFWREAPEDIQNKALEATKLSLEMYSTAHKKARGEWFEEYQVDSKKLVKKFEHCILQVA